MKLNDSGPCARFWWFGLVAASSALIFASCTSSRWRSPEKGWRTSSLPRVDFAIVRDAVPDDRVGVKQIVDGKPYAVEESRYFRVSKAYTDHEPSGHSNLHVDIHSSSKGDFERWTKSNIGRSIGIAVDGQFAWVGEIQQPVRDQFTIVYPEHWTELQRRQLFLRLNGYGAQLD